MPNRLQFFVCEEALVCHDRADRLGILYLPIVDHLHKLIQLACLHIDKLILVQMLALPAL